MKIRVGLGFDVHQLVEGRDLIIGGIKIDHFKVFLVIVMQMCLFMRCATPFLVQPTCAI